jgi:hypothetical protein
MSQIVNIRQLFLKGKKVRKKPHSKTDTEAVFKGLNPVWKSQSGLDAPFRISGIPYDEIF